MRTSLLVEIPTLMTMKHGRTLRRELSWRLLQRTNSAMLLVSPIQTSQILSCPRFIKDMIQKWNYIKMTSMEYSPYMVHVFIIENGNQLHFWVILRMIYNVNICPWISLLGKPEGTTTTSSTEAPISTTETTATTRFPCDLKIDAVTDGKCMKISWVKSSIWIDNYVFMITPVLLQYWKLAFYWSQGQMDMFTFSGGVLCIKWDPRESFLAFLAPFGASSQEPRQKMSDQHFISALKTKWCSLKVRQIQKRISENTVFENVIQRCQMKS